MTEAESAFVHSKMAINRLRCISFSQINAVNSGAQVRKPIKQLIEN